MTREPTNQFRDENPHQGPSHSFGVPSASRTPPKAERERERERGIDTRREHDRGVSGERRADVTSPTYSTIASPFSMMRRLAEDMDRMFEDFAFGQRGTPASRLDPTGLRSVWAPEIEMFRRGDKLVVRADLPGLRKEDVKVDIENDMLTIEGERNAESREEDDGYYRTERSYGHFYRAIPLPEGVDENECDATFKDGVLEVVLAAPEQPRNARSIQVR